MRKQNIITLLNKLNISFEERPISYGYSFHFSLVGARYNLFTSSWKDYGLHFLYEKKSGGKIHQCKIIDFEKDLTRIEAILKPIVEYRDEENLKRNSVKIKV